VKENTIFEFFYVLKLFFFEQLCISLKTTKKKKNIFCFVFNLNIYIYIYIFYEDTFFKKCYQTSTYNNLINKKISLIGIKAYDLPWHHYVR
jgi:hypothetical protein